MTLLRHAARDNNVTQRRRATSNVDPSTSIRICSLLPSATEILYSIGLGNCVVGVTHECDFPPEAAGKPALIRPRVDPQAPAAEIDRQVSELAARSESIYAVDAELIERLSPDLIVTQDLCHVCAASPDELATALTRLARMPQVLSLTPHTLHDVWEDIRRVGKATERCKQAESLAAELERRVREIEKAAVRAGSRPRVVCLEWLDPYYVAGHWVPEMVAKAGGQDVLGQAGQPSSRVTSEQIAKSAADVMVIMPCGYGLDRAAAEARAIQIPAAWDQLPAIRGRRVFAVNANAYFSRPGPRLAEGVGLLAEIFHPNLFAGRAMTSACRRI